MVLGYGRDNAERFPVVYKLFAPMYRDALYVTEHLEHPEITRDIELQPGARGFSALSDLLERRLQSEKTRKSLRDSGFPILKIKIHTRPKNGQTLGSMGFGATGPHITKPTVVSITVITPGGATEESSQIEIPNLAEGIKVEYLGKRLQIWGDAFFCLGLLIAIIGVVIEHHEKDDTRSLLETGATSSCAPNVAASVLE